MARRQAFVSWRFRTCRTKATLAIGWMLDPRRAEKLVDVCFEVPQWAPAIATNGCATAAAGNITPTQHHPRRDGSLKAFCHKSARPLCRGSGERFKTTVALDLSVCVMADLPFADRYRVKRRGAVLYLALEGEGVLHARLSAIASHHGVTGPLPFAWRGDCPALMDKGAADKLTGIADEAAAELKRKCGFPVSLIWIDTMITAAGFAAGEDNDTAAAQR